MYDRYGLFIGGTWRPAGDGATLPVVDPATEETIGHAPAATEADVDAAIEAARAGMAAWRTVPSWDRARIIRRIGALMDERRDELTRWITQEIGRPAAQCAGEIQLCIDQFDWFAEETKRIYGQVVESRLPNGRIYVTYEPVGVVAAFSAWNFPLVLLARKIAPALAAGCAIICRPSEEAPGAAMALVKCCEDAGVPPGAVNLLTGKASLISARLMQSPVVRKVSLTGSTEVGKLLIRASADTVKRLSMELGGHAPVIVFDDVDAERIADLSVAAKFRNTGQICVSPSRFYIHESQAEIFTRRFVEKTKTLRIGDGRDPATDVGPLATRRRLQAIEDLVARTREDGARQLCGGQRPSGFNRGFFYEPTVFDQVPDTARIMNEEPFGPVVPITTFRDFGEVMARANSVPYGLASYVFTRDLERAHAASGALEAGMCAVNTYALATAEAPFGGVKESGFGREGGAQGIKDYLDVKYTNMVLA